MCEIRFSVADNVLHALKLNAEQARAQLRMLAAVKLYEMKRLTSGAAAKLAGVPKPAFLRSLGDYGVATFRQSAEELQEEFDNS